MIKQVIGKCPICDNKLTVTRLTCKNCNLDMTGDFELSKFSYLKKDELDFIETFLRYQGNLKDVQNVLGISYPTAKKQLDNVLINLGYSAAETKEENQNKNMDILQMVQNGEISMAEGVALIKQNKNKN